MFTIEVKLFAGAKKKYSLADEQTALFYFKSFVQCIDVSSVIMIDGLTGEVLNEYRDKQFTILNGCVL